MNQPIFLSIVIAFIFCVLGLVIGYIYRKTFVENKISRSEKYANDLVEDAIKKSDEKKKEIILEAKEESIKIRSELDKELKERRSEVAKTEKRLQQREEILDKKIVTLDKREEQLLEKQEKVQEILKDAEEVKSKQIFELEKIAELTQEEALQKLVQRIEKDAYRQAAKSVIDIENKAKEEAEKKARNIISLAIQRCSSDHVAETTVSVINLPNDDMKGRIIGREGRNIRALEQATGVDLIIDDTPEAVVISGFDPVRREIARIAIEKLIMDGRIHPARIEETVEKARKDVETQIKEAGEQAVFETKMHNIHPEIVKTLGRLKYRTSYGQNVLKHSIEVSHICGMLAAEIGANVELAKRAGLLHDIGKALDHEQEGTHVTIGAELARKHHESPAVIHCIMAHHNDVEPQTVEAVLVQAADAISAARPGARRESLENYIKRLEKLEEIAHEFNGVDKCYAVQSGREVRIMVKPEDVNDEATKVMALEIAKRIEKEMEYPGQIKVNVIRETRYTEYAK